MRLPTSRVGSRQPHFRCADARIDKPSLLDCHAEVMHAGYRSPGVHSSVLLVSAVVLAIERVAYAAIWQRPDAFARASRRLAPAIDPVDALSALFAAFKVLQATVFVAWCLVHSGSLARASDSLAGLVAGGALLAVGQVLNLAVFARLGRVGVFYGSRLGHVVPWCRGFPFSWIRHPQYVGTVLSIWGFFVVMRWPAPDWAAIPLLETAYYLVGGLLEQASPPAGITQELAPRPTAAGRRAARRLP
jgi:phosphatidyl-N-methylethanolamine N-methyltransferase